MTQQTPHQAAALHRAEINLTLNLNSTYPIPSHHIPSLLSALRLLHAEACLLANLNYPAAPTDDQRDLRRLNRLVRTIAPCTQFLKALTPPADTRLVAAAARAVAAFALLRVAHHPDLVTALAAFVSLASDEFSTWCPVVLNHAVDVVPALHVLLDNNPSHPYYDAALSALPVLIQIATEFAKLTLAEAHRDRRDGMFGVAHIAVSVVATVLNNRPTYVSSLQSHLKQLCEQTAATLPDSLDAQSLHRDVRHLLLIVPRSSDSHTTSTGDETVC